MKQLVWKHLGKDGSSIGRTLETCYFLPFFFWPSNFAWSGLKRGLLTQLGPIKGGLSVRCRLEFFENVGCQLENKNFSVGLRWRHRHWFWFKRQCRMEKKWPVSSVRNTPFMGPTILGCFEPFPKVKKMVKTGLKCAPYAIDGLFVFPLTLYWFHMSIKFSCTNLCNFHNFIKFLKMDFLLVCA